jgi:hypothetical protein
MLLDSSTTVKVNGTLVNEASGHINGNGTVDASGAGTFTNNGAGQGSVTVTN